MLRAMVSVHGVEAAIFTEFQQGSKYTLEYLHGYNGPPVSLTLTPENNPFEFSAFPAFFDGLLPEGIQLESLLRTAKIDKQDHMAQLLCVGEDLVGAVTVREIESGPS